MKTDPQHLLPAHLPFYRRRWFWGAIVAIVFSLNNIYVVLRYGLSLKTVLFANIIFPTLLFSEITSSEIIGISSSLILYTTLLYFSFFRKKVNFYAIAILITSAIFGVISLNNFTGY
jgi:hypothetical protein